MPIGHFACSFSQGRERASFSLQRNMPCDVQMRRTEAQSQPAQKMRTPNDETVIACIVYGRSTLPLLHFRGTACFPVAIKPLYRSQLSDSKGESPRSSSPQSHFRTATASGMQAYPNLFALLLLFQEKPRWPAECDVLPPPQPPGCRCQNRMHNLWAAACRSAPRTSRQTAAWRRLSPAPVLLLRVRPQIQNRNRGRTGVRG